jgi:hypothetical protein
MTNLKPGDRCVIIKSFVGDEGKIVVIVGFHQPDRWFADCLWDEECDVVVRSLGSKLHSRTKTSATPYEPLYERPHRSNWLQKLPEVPAEARDVLEELFVRAGSVS